MSAWLARNPAPALRFAVLFFASYGAFYFSYKWYALPDPDFLRHYAQNDLNPLSFAQGMTPHVLRQGSAVLTWLIYHAGIYYPSLIAFHAPGLDQRLFFAALLANYVGLLTAAGLAGSI